MSGRLPEAGSGEWHIEGSLEHKVGRGEHGAEKGDCDVTTQAVRGAISMESCPELGIRFSPLAAEWPVLGYSCHCGARPQDQRLSLSRGMHSSAVWPHLFQQQGGKLFI